MMKEITIRGQVENFEQIDSIFLSAIFGIRAATFIVSLESPMKIGSKKPTDRVLVRIDTGGEIPRLDGQLAEIKGFYDEDRRIFQSNFVTVDRLNLVLKGIKYLSVRAAGTYLALYIAMLSSWLIALSRGAITYFGDTIISALDRSNAHGSILFVAGLGLLFVLIFVPFVFFLFAGAVVRTVALSRVYQTLSLYLRRWTEYSGAP